MKLFRNIPFRVRVIHMASMARSGETVMLRSLNAHSRIHVVHNLASSDSASESGLFQYLKSLRSTKIWANHKYLRDLNLTRGTKLLLKQSVWEHPFPFEGFLLARNPLAIFSSLKYYDVPSGSRSWEPFWSGNTERFVRWLGDIEPSLVHGFRRLSPLDQFCIFFNRRMGGLANLGLPIVHYERLVLAPLETLKHIVQDIFELPWEAPVPRSHEAYKLGTEGHGKIDLGAPISSQSIYRYRDLLTTHEQKFITERTQYVATLLGYSTESEHMTINGAVIPNELA